MKGRIRRQDVAIKVAHVEDVLDMHSSTMNDSIEWGTVSKTSLMRSQTDTFLEIICHISWTCGSAAHFVLQFRSDK